MSGNHAREASKSRAIQELKEMLKFESLITFGNGKIASNNEDGVARWLKENSLK